MMAALEPLIVDRRKSKAVSGEKMRHITEMPVTWQNWYQHVNWLSTSFIIIIPLMAFVAAYFHPLHCATAIFSAVYLFNTGLGITAGAHT